MRTYGRLPPDPVTGKKKWVVITTSPTGDNSAVWLTTLCQVFPLNLNESPFFADYGLPARDAVAQQVAPDFYVTKTQQQFAGFFANLTITKVPGTVDPIYLVNAITKQGALLSAAVAF